MAHISHAPIYHIDRHIKADDSFQDEAYYICEFRKQETQNLETYAVCIVRMQGEMQSVLTKQVHELKDTQERLKPCCLRNGKFTSEGMESDEKRSELRLKETALSLLQKSVTCEKNCKSCKS